MLYNQFSRREMILFAGKASIYFVLTSSSLKKKKRRDIMIGACDWSLGYSGDPAAFRIAKEIGLDGVQVNMGSVESDMHLRLVSVQQEYKRISQETGVKIAGLALGEMNKIPYKSDPRTIKWVSDSIDVAAALGCKVVLLAFFYAGDLKDDLAGQKVVIERLREVMPKAESKGIILGIESWLSADEHVRIIEAVGSPNLKVYYDVANSIQMGYDIYAEIEQLGDLICELHMKENGALLGQGKVDFDRVYRALKKIDYRGWIQIEGAMPPGGSLVESYRANHLYLRKTFKL